MLLSLFSWPSWMMVPASSMAYSLCSCWRPLLTEKLRNGPERRDQSAGLSSSVWPALQGDGLIFHLAGLGVVHLGHPSSNSRAGHGESLALGVPTTCRRAGIEELLVGAFSCCLETQVSHLQPPPGYPVPKYTHPAQAAWWLTCSVLESRSSTLMTQENAKCLKMSDVRSKLQERQEFGYTSLPDASYQLMIPAVWIILA